MAKQSEVDMLVAKIRALGNIRSRLIEELEFERDVVKTLRGLSDLHDRTREERDEAVAHNLATSQKLTQLESDLAAMTAERNTLGRDGDRQRAEVSFLHAQIESIISVAIGSRDGAQLARRPHFLDQSHAIARGRSQG